jgi:chromate transporter
VVPAVAINAALGLLPASWTRIGPETVEHVRWLVYALLGGSAAATAGPYLVFVLIACGVAEILIRRRGRPARPRSAPGVVPAMIGHAVAAGGLGALAWVALKVGALSYGGGFVIIPLMQHDAVTAYHWMTAAQFLDAVALGQITPGPVVQTVAVVGYAAGGVWGGLLAALVAFAPSFLFVLVGAPHFDRIRTNPSIAGFLTGAGPAVIGAIAGSAIPLGLSFGHLWQIPVLGGALLWLFLARRGVVSALLLGGTLGIVLALVGVPV